MNTSDCSTSQVDYIMTCPDSHTDGATGVQNQQLDVADGGIVYVRFVCEMETNTEPTTVISTVKPTSKSSMMPLIKSTTKPMMISTAKPTMTPSESPALTPATAAASASD